MITKNAIEINVWDRKTIIENQDIIKVQAILPNQIIFLWPTERDSQIFNPTNSKPIIYLITPKKYIFWSEIYVQDFWDLF